MRESGRRDGNGPETREESGRASLTEKEKVVVLAIFAAIFLLATVIVFFVSRYVGGSPQNVGTCENYAFQDQQYSCIDSYAIASKNASACNVLPQAYEWGCIYGLAKVEYNLDLCASINSSSEYYYDCVTGLSTSAQNMSYCNSMPSQQGLECIDNLSERSNYSDIGACDSLSNHTYSIECDTVSYYEMALKTNSASYCGLLSGAYNRTLLYAIAQAPEPPNSSENFSAGEMVYIGLNASARDLCLYRLGKCSLSATENGHLSCGS